MALSCQVLPPVRQALIVSGAFCRGNSPDETVLSIAGNGDLEMSRYRQFSNALRYNKLRAHLTTVVHPDGLLDGVSAVGLSKGNWPIPSW